MEEVSILVMPERIRIKGEGVDQPMVMEQTGNLNKSLFNNFPHGGFSAVRSGHRRIYYKNLHFVTEDVTYLEYKFPQ